MNTSKWGGLRRVATGAILMVLAGCAGYPEYQVPPPQRVEVTASPNNLQVTMTPSSTGEYELAEPDLLVTARVAPRGPADRFDPVGAIIYAYAVVWTDESGREDAQLVIPKKEMRPPVHLRAPIAGSASESTFMIPVLPPAIRDRLEELSSSVAKGVSTPYRCQVTLWMEDENFNSITAPIEIPIWVQKK